MNNAKAISLVTPGRTDSWFPAASVLVARSAQVRDTFAEFRTTAAASALPVAMAGLGLSLLAIAVVFCAELPTASLLSGTFGLLLLGRANGRHAPQPDESTT